MNIQHGFELIKEQPIPELNTTARFFRHVKTAAQFLSLENDDENKVFGIAFRTPPPDSTGLPHIMEHSVLCGSRKYPLKEPFVELIKGSLQTFVNAFTSPDKTTYPVASQNVKDLYNLVDVYLDAVLYPRITRHIFEQEGWHYELEAPDQPMTFRGVVYNEMKGAYSSPESVLARYSQRSIFPDTPYGLDSGGDPAAIPTLTYEQFKAFHETYYHPSNARIFWYGDDDPTERLRYLNSVLQEFEARPVDSALPLQPRLNQPGALTIPYDAGEGDTTHKGMVTLNWLLNESTDAETTLGLTILTHILIGTPASPLRKALIDSGLGEDLTGGGLDSRLRQMAFSTGLKGISVEDAHKVETLILYTLQSLVQHGIDADMLEAAMNTTEFRLRENNTGSFPRGISLMMRSLGTWLHDGDPFAPLAFEAPLQSLKNRLASGERYFENLIRDYLANNQHRSMVLLTPDATVRSRQAAEEQARLDQARAAMTPEQIQAVLDNTRELKRLQETPDSPEALATLPTLTLADLDPQNKTIPLSILRDQAPVILYHDLFTNGIVYLDVGFDLHTIPQDLLPYLPLFGEALLKIGTETEDFVKLTQRIGQKTGGIWANPFVSARKQGSQAQSWLILRGKATVAHTDDLLAILRDVLLTVKLDNQERFKQMVLEARSDFESSLVPYGHGMASMRLSAHFSEAGWLTEQMSGINGLFFTRQLAEDVEHRWPDVLQKLEALRQILINRQAMLCNVTLDQQNWTQVQPKLDEFFKAFPVKPLQTAIWNAQPPTPFEGLTIPARVNFVAKGANLYASGYRYHGSVLAILNYLRTTWLWDRVRVRGGAYGGFCSFDRFSGVFSYLSYRDPHLLSTLDAYDQAGEFLQQTTISEDELTKSIIGAIGQMDAYQLPDAKGFSSLVRHLIGISETERQQTREELLATRPEHFKAFGDVLRHVKEQGLVVVLGSKEAIDEANTARPNWLTTLNVL